MPRTLSYLDYNATAPMRPWAREALLAALAQTGNPSSVHRAGRRARGLVEAAREQIAAAIGAQVREIVFTSGGTEANHLALRGATVGMGARAVLTSAVEHDSLLAAARACDAEHVLVPVDRDGVIDLDALDGALARAAGPALVSVMLANNETGVIQPVAEVARLAHRHGAFVHCDAAQALGRVAVAMTDLDVDLWTLSAHKAGGIAGAGALVVRDGLRIAPLLTGGGQEEARRAGTENVAGIAAFGAAAQAAASDCATGESERVRTLRDRMEAAIRARAPEAVLVGARVPRLANTSCVALPGVPAELQVIALDLAGVAVSAGSACSSGKVRRSHVLAAMGLGDGIAGCAIRISLGWASTEDDVNRLVTAWDVMRARMIERTHAALV